MTKIEKKLNLMEFTLVELMVVISIILILMSILLPTLKRAKDRVKEIKCASQLRNVSKYLMFYSNDYDDYYPEHWDDTRKYQIERMGYDLIGSLYLPNPYKQFWRSTVARCPCRTGKDVNVYSFSYGLRYQMISSHGKISKINSPSTFLLSIERDFHYFEFSPSKAALLTDAAVFRHLGWMNLLLLDGHVDKYKQEIFTSASQIYKEYQ